MARRSETARRPCPPRAQRSGRNAVEDLGGGRIWSEASARRPACRPGKFFRRTGWRGATRALALRETCRDGLRISACKETLAEAPGRRHLGLGRAGTETPDPLRCPSRSASTMSARTVTRPSRRRHRVGNGLPRQCGRAARQADSHGERDDGRAAVPRCWPHDRHNDGRNSRSPPVAEAIWNGRRKAVRTTATGSHAEGLHADLSERLQLWVCRDRS